MFKLYLGASPKCCHLPTDKPSIAHLIFADGIPAAMVEMAKDLKMIVNI